MIETMKIGPSLPTRLARCYSNKFTAGFGLPTVVRHAGMEHLASPYMLLLIDERPYLLLERYNDDGEWAPQLYDVDDDLDLGDADAVWRYTTLYGDHAQELTVPELVERGFRVDDWSALNQVLENLYLFRDQLSYRSGS